MSLVTTGNLSLLGSLTKAFDHADGNFPASLGVPLNMSTGTGANQADLVFSDQRTTATESLDLSGTLTDAFGDTLTMVRVKAILIKAAAANTLDVFVGGGSNPLIGWVADPTDIVEIKPGGAFMVWAPDATAYPVTASTGDILKVAASDGATSITYDIIIIGASA
jgi:hypothetical protein